MARNITFQRQSWLLQHEAGPNQGAHFVIEAQQSRKPIVFAKVFDDIPTTQAFEKNFWATPDRCLLRVYG